MTNPDQIDAVVKVMSPAQRKLVLEAEEAAWGSHYLISSKFGSPTWHRLLELGIINNAVNTRALSDLGLLVRDRLRGVQDG